MPALVLLPGLACDAEVWRDQLAALAPHAPQVSDVHARFDTLPDMAAALLAEHDGPLALAGASMGGMVALEAWRQAPGRIAGLALLGTTARPDTAEVLALRADAIERFAQGRVEEVLRANLAFAFRARGADPDVLARYLGMVRRAGAGQLIRQNRAVMARTDLRPMLGTIRCPTLVACGEGDQLTPPECAREIAAAIPGARLAMVADAGHMLTMEEPICINESLQEWMAECA